MNSNERDLREYVRGIKELDKGSMDAARLRLDSLAKPPGSLGKLESIAVTLSGISGDMYYDNSKRCVIIMASDNGVTEEGIASAPQSVTYWQTINFMKGITGVAVLAKQFNADLIVVDVGVNADFSHPGIINRKIRKSTGNIAKTHAMSREEAVQAVMIGIEMAEKAATDGYKMIGVGEMGIGNTTSASAVLSALAGLPADQTSGKGAGLDEKSFVHKKEIIDSAITRYRPDSSDPIDVISKLGGFDIAAMAGVYIGAARMRLPVVIDGFISAVAALTAYRLAPLSKEYMLASHASFEQGFSHTMKELGLEAPLVMDMRLGEGSGCPLMFAMVDAACCVIKNMGTFADASIDDQYLENIRGAESFVVNHVLGCMGEGSGEETKRSDFGRR